MVSPGVKAQSRNISTLSADGALNTVEGEETGVTSAKYTAASLMDAILRLEEIGRNPCSTLHRYTERFDGFVSRRASSDVLYERLGTCPAEVATK